MVVFPDQFSVHTDGATCGQQVVQLRYRSTAQGEGRSWMGRRQRLLYGLLAVGGAWLEERLDSITASVRHIKYTTQVGMMSEREGWEEEEGSGGEGWGGMGRAGQGRAGQGRAGQGRAGQGRAGQGRAGQGRAGEKKEREIHRGDSHGKKEQDGMRGRE